MCEPTTILMIGTAVAGLAMQQQQADYQTSVNQQTTRNALLARADNANQVNLEQQQQHDAATQKINANDQNMREAQSTAIAAAGPSGLSVDALLGDMGAKGENYNSSVEQNLQRDQMAFQNQLTNVNNQASNTINQERTPAQPDYLGTALKIGGMAYGAYTKSPGGGTTTTADLSGVGGNLTGYQDRNG